MEKEIEIVGYVYPEKKLERDEFEDLIIAFVESHHFYFGGGFEYFSQNNSYLVRGCMTVNSEYSKSEVADLVINFAREHRWAHNLKFSEIIDGYYINEDGSKGKHVFEEDAL